MSNYQCSQCMAIAKSPDFNSLEAIISFQVVFFFTFVFHQALLNSFGTSATYIEKSFSPQTFSEKRNELNRRLALRNLNEYIKRVPSS